MNAEPGEPRFKVTSRIDVVDENGEIIAKAGSGYSEGPMPSEAIRFDVAEQIGELPETVSLPGMDAPVQERASRKAGRLSVGFSANHWNSSWEPGKDSKGNTILN